MFSRRTYMPSSYMYIIELQNGIHKTINGFIRIGFWHQGDEATVKETIIKIVYSIHYGIYPLLLLLGAFASDSKYESMFLAEASIICVFSLMRLWYTMWRQKEIHALLHRIGVHSIKDEDDFNEVNGKLNSFIKWTTYFFYDGIVVASCVALVLPFTGSEKKIFPKIAFPLDYENDETAYWITFLYNCSELLLSAFSMLFSLIIWYLLFNCSLKYKILGSELRNLGVIRSVNANIEKQELFYRDLLAAIESHKNINKSLQELESFLSNILSFQLSTSALRICVSIYSLAFDKIEHIMELHIYFYVLFYNIFDIFMVLYFANEIKVSSDGLSYCLFQSNWMDQSQSCKKTIFTFGERLKQSKHLVVLKIYHLTLETFTRILNGAYSLFNILKTLA